MAHSLKMPELIDFTMTGSLHDLAAFFDLVILDHYIHLIEIALDNIDFASFVNVPSLIVSVIRIVNYEIFVFIAG